MSAVTDAYAEKLERWQKEAALQGRRAQRIGTLRLLSFGAAVLCAIGAFHGFPGGFLPDIPVLLFWGLLLLFAGTFVALVLHHEQVLKRRERAQHLVVINQRGLTRLRGEWTAEPPFAPLPGVVLPPYSTDLDLVGEASVLQLVDSTHTYPGQMALVAALGRAAAPHPEVERATQEAVRELVPLLELRQALEAEGRMLIGLRPEPSSKKGNSNSPPDPTPFLSWAEGEPVLSADWPWLRFLVFLPLLSVPLVALKTFWPEPLPLVARLGAALLGLQLLIVFLISGKVGRLLSIVASRERALDAYCGMLEILSAAPFQTLANRALKDALATGSVPAVAKLRRLQGSCEQLQIRKNVFFWLPLNLFLLWDLFFALRIERWQAQFGKQVRSFFSALGELEARASLAGLGHDNPDWAWPELLSGPAQFAAQELSHPLIPAGRRVGNDVNLLGPGTAWLITGSNMSGKSTLLRSIGLCQVLAHAGAPVCARSARLSFMRLRTVMRVDDSLAQGVSHFYAELLRLKEVYEAAKDKDQDKQSSAGDAALCYLLDEILHGTNTRERELGARALIKALCRSGAMGVVSTHDLSLKSLEQETAGAVRNYHFTDAVHGNEMTFDYRLRQGPVQTTNALRLLRLCGIDLDWEENRSTD